MDANVPPDAAVTWLLRAAHAPMMNVQPHNVMTIGDVARKWQGFNSRFPKDAPPAHDYTYETLPDYTPDMQGRKNPFGYQPGLDPTKFYNAVE